MSVAISPIPSQEMEHPLAELDAMRRMLEVSLGTFSHSVAVCNSQALRDYLIRRLTDDRPGIDVLSVPAETKDPYGFVTSRLGSVQPDALFVVDLERSIPSGETGQDSLLSLNASRELWQKRFRCPVVFWLPEYAATLMSVTARDLWRYCSHHFSFPAHGTSWGPSAADRVSGDLLAASNLSQDEKHFRIAELQQRLADADASPGPALARHQLLWLNELASLHFDLGKVDEARRLWQRLSLLASEFGLQPESAAAQNNLGNAWAALGDVRKAVEYFERALAVCRSISDRRGEGTTLGNLGIAWADLGDARKAIDFQEQALAAAREIGDRRGEGNVLGSLGNAWAQLGDAPKAIAYYEQNLAIARAIGDRWGEGNALNNLGNALAALGNVQEAIGHYERRLVIAREIGDRRGEGNALGNLGNAWADIGDARKAASYHAQNVAIAREIGDRRGEGHALGNLGMAWSALGDAREAIGCYQQTLAIARETGDRRSEANSLFNSARSQAQLGELAEAAQQAERAAEIFAAMESPHADRARQLAATLRGR